VTPIAGLADGTQITNLANVVFDANTAPFLLPLPGPIVAIVSADPSPWLQSLSIVLGPMLEFKTLA
jgi:hypothetical protein